MHMLRTEVVALTSEDLAEIDGLRQRADDYFREVGDPEPSPATFQADLDDLPAGYTRGDELIYRMRDSAGVLQAYAEVLRGFATPDQWMIGLLLVAEDSRCRGIGRQVVDGIAADAATAGARSLAAGVIVTRERSMRFWNANGFETEAARRPMTVCGIETEVVRLVRELGQG